MSKVQLQPGGIMIIFKEHSGTGDEHVYVYTNESCGADTVEKMKELAKRGAELNRFINQIRPPYDPAPQAYGIEDLSTRRAIQVAGAVLEPGADPTDFEWIHYFGED